MSDRDSTHLVQRKPLLNSCPVSRKQFIKTSLSATAAAAIGCGGDSTGVDSEPDPDGPIQAVISGPSQIQIPTPWGRAISLYDSRLSTGGSLNRVWKLWKDIDPLSAPVLNLGDGGKVNVALTRTGTYTLELRVYRNGEDSTATKEITVLPPSNSADYPLIGFYRHVMEEGNLRMVLHLMDPSSGATTPFMGDTGPSLGGYKMTWERGSRRLATEDRSRNLVVYDLIHDTYEVIAGSGSLNARMPSWNPQTDWIAFVEGGDAGRGFYLEGALIRPDGSEKRYLGGDTFRPEFRGNYPSWSPEGERLAMSQTVWDDWRISVYDDLWGNTQRTQIPSEAQLLAFLVDRGANDIVGRSSISPGLGGVSWSPDGEWLAYDLWYAHMGRGYDFLVKSRTDGTGDIHILVPGNDQADFHRPTWSPSGGQVLFGDNSGKIRSVSSAGGSVTDLISGYEDTAPAWWC